MPPVAQRELMEIVGELLDRAQNSIASYSELSRRMHEVDQRRNAESWRRDLRRWRESGGAPERDIAVLALAFNVDRGVFPAAKQRTTVAELDRRLAALEAAVGLVQEGSTVGNLLEELAAKLADAVDRIEELERERGHDGAARRLIQ